MKSIALTIMVLFILGNLSDAVESVLIPNLEGNSSDLARVYLEELGLDPKITWCFSDSVEIGEIIPGSQNPSAGKPAKIGSIVRAQASNGSFPKNLIGMTKSQASNILNERYLPYRINYGLPATSPVGFVYDQSPSEFSGCIYPEFEIDLFVNGKTKANITDPKNGSHVSSAVNIAGKLLDHIDNDTSYLWIAVRPCISRDHWWPQSGGPLLIQDKYFSGLAYLGGSNDDPFEIAVLMVNQTTSNNFAKWEKISKQTNYWPPITKESKAYNSISKNEIEKMKIGSLTVILSAEK